MVISHLLLWDFMAGYRVDLTLTRLFPTFKIRKGD
jgi:hypothetical protein